jgi:hypothetical protein
MKIATATPRTRTKRKLGTYAINTIIFCHF